MTLNIVLFLPLLGFLVLLLISKETSRVAALVISLAIFVVSLALLAPYWYANPTGFSFSTNIPWIDDPAINYHVGLDGLSLWLVLLTTLLTPIAVLVSWKHIDHRVKEFYAFLILLEFGLIGVFVALDLFLFFVFWEVSLVPMYFLIGIWGHERRIYATVKFFLYTMVGSMLMLAAIIYVYNKSGSFDYVDILSQIQTGRLAFDSARPDAAVPGVLYRFCDQSPAVPAPHLAARRARRSAHGRFRHAGVRDVENGHLRLNPLLPAAVPRCRARFGALGRRPRHHRNHLRSPGRHGAAQHEEAGGVFFRQPSRFRRARNFFVHPAGPGRSGIPDAEPRRLYRSPVHAGRLPV